MLKAKNLIDFMFSSVIFPFSNTKQWYGKHHPDVWGFDQRWFPLLTHLVGALWDMNSTLMGRNMAAFIVIMKVLQADAAS